MLLEIDKKLKDYYDNAFIDRIKFFTKYKYFYSQISNKINNLAFGDILFVGLGHIEYLKILIKKFIVKKYQKNFFVMEKKKMKIFINMMKMIIIYLIKYLFLRLKMT